IQGNMGRKAIRRVLNGPLFRRKQPSLARFGLLYFSKFNQGSFGIVITAIGYQVQTVFVYSYVLGIITFGPEFVHLFIGITLLSVSPSNNLVDSGLGLVFHSKRQCWQL